MSSDIDVMTLRFTMKGHLRDNASIDNIFIDALIRCMSREAFYHRLQSLDHLSGYVPIASSSKNSGEIAQALSLI